MRRSRRLPTRYLALGILVSFSLGACGNATSPTPPTPSPLASPTSVAPTAIPTPQPTTLTLQDRRVEIQQYLRAFNQLYYDWRTLIGPFRFPQPGDDYTPFLQQAGYAAETIRRIRALTPPLFDGDAALHRDAGVVEVEGLRKMMLGGYQARLDNDTDAASRAVRVYSDAIRTADLEGRTERLALKYNLTFSEVGYKPR